MALSAIVGLLRVILSADTALFGKGLDDAAKKAQGFEGHLLGLSKQVTAFNKVFTGLFITGGFGIAAQKVLDYAGKIQDLADQTQLTTDTIQEMDFAAKQTGKSLEGFTNAAFKLQTNLAEGTQKIQGAVEALGLSYTDLKASSPDEQFRATVVALGKVENAQERARLGVILMGKGYKETAAAINEGYDDLANRANKASKEQIEALARAGDEWDAFKSKLLNIGVQLGASFARAMDANMVAFRQDAEFLNKYVGVVRITQQAVEDWKSIFQIAAEGPEIFAASLKKNLPAALANQTLSMEEAEQKAKELDAQIEKSIETNKAAAKAAEEFAAALRAIGGADAAGGAKEVLKQLEALGGPLNVLPSQLESMADKLREGAQAAMLVGDADLAGQYTKLADTLNPIIQFQQRFNVTVGEYVTMAPEAAEWTEELNRQLHELGGTLITIGPLLKSSMDLSKLFVGFKGTVTQNLPNKEQWSVAWGPMKDGLKVALAELPATLARAFEGGGNIWGAVKSFASQIGSIIGMAFGGQSKTGQAIGAAIGSLLGPLLQGFKKLFGIGINEEIRKFNKEIETSKAKLISTYGSFERIQRLGNAVGVDLAGAWKSQGEAGKKHFDKLAADFETAVAKMESDLEGFRGELDGAIDEAAEMGYIFDRQGNLVSVSFREMQASAEEFGVDLQALGPSFQAARLAADAGKIINAFELLAKGGTDVGTILFGMKDEISKLVQESMKFGTTIPANMRPWIQNLIDTGQLLDENGQAITDIGQIRFGAAIETQFEGISRKIQDLIGKIDNLVQILIDQLTPALDNATRDRTVHVGWDVDAPPADLNHGYGGEAPAFATGTMGQMGRWFGNFGSGMGATLHGVEAVVTPDQAPAFAMDVLGRLGTQQQQSAPVQRPITIQNAVESRILLDGTEMKRWILKEITTAIENNERGIRSLQRDALGITS